MKRKVLSILAILMMALTAQAETVTVTITTSDMPPFDYFETNSFTKDGVTVSVGSLDGGGGNFFDGGTFSTTLGNFTKIVVNCEEFAATGSGWSGATWTGNATSVSFSGDIEFITSIVCTIEAPDATALTLSEATDNTTDLTTNDGQVANVTLTRTLQAGGWNTFCAPFSTATPTGWTVKELTASEFNSSTGALSLTFATAASIVAGTPYLVKVTGTVENPTFDGVTISKDGVTTETTAVNFVPTLGLTEITGDANDILFLSSGNTLLHPTALPANMKGFRAYFLLKGEAALAKAFRMDFGDGEATGIISIENGQPATSSAVYDLQGRRINGTAQKGVYVVSGKKVIIK